MPRNPQRLDPVDALNVFKVVRQANVSIDRLAHAQGQRPKLAPEKNSRHLFAGIIPVIFRSKPAHHRLVVFKEVDGVARAWRGLESPFVAAPHNVKLLQAQCAHAGIPGREIWELLLDSVVLFYF